MSPTLGLSYTVTYNSENHWSVITQMWGSTWPKVLPYCILNVCLMIGINQIEVKFGTRLKLEISAQMHTFMTLVVAFLLVSRVNIGLSRYNQARECLGTMYKEIRELIQNMTVFSSDSKDQAAKEWRNELAYRCLVMLHTAMAVIDYPDTKLPAWSVPELQGYEREDIQDVLYITPKCARWAHARRGEWEESMRVPIRLAYLVRKTIYSQSKRLPNPIPIPQELKLYSSVDSFMSGYYGIRRFLTTPTPFPLIQMARTLLFLYVYTVPFVLLNDKSSTVSHCFAVFFMTYGFLGLETISIELDNPFGDDPNDFDNMGMAKTAYEDTYLTILDIDGAEWVDNLRLRMHDQSIESLPTEQSWLLSKVV